MQRKKEQSALALTSEAIIGRPVLCVFEMRKSWCLNRGGAIMTHLDYSTKFGVTIDFVQANWILVTPHLID